MQSNVDCKYLNGSLRDRHAATHIQYDQTPIKNLIYFLLGILNQTPESTKF